MVLTLAAFDLRGRLFFPCTSSSSSIRTACGGFSDKAVGIERRYVCVCVRVCSYICVCADVCVCLCVCVCNNVTLSLSLSLSLSLGDLVSVCAVVARVRGL